MEMVQHARLPAGNCTIRKYKRCQRAPEGSLVGLCSSCLCCYDETAWHTVSFLWVPSNSFLCSRHLPIEDLFSSMYSLHSSPLVFLIVSALCVWCRRPTRRCQAGCRAWEPVHPPLEVASAAAVVAIALAARTSGGRLVATVRPRALCACLLVFGCPAGVHTLDYMYLMYSDALGSSLHLHSIADAH